MTDTAKGSVAPDGAATPDRLGEIAYRLWIACRDKEVSTDAVTMIADALRDAGRPRPQPTEIRFAEYLMCTILREQSNPDWQADPVMLRTVSEALDGYVRTLVAKALANQVKP